jgi:hypothetical protein
MVDDGGVRISLGAVAFILIRALSQFAEASVNRFNVGGTRVGIVVIGSGPSLVSDDVRMVQGFPTFAFNRSYLIFDAWDFRPTYYAALDPVALERVSSDLVSKVLPSVSETVFLERRGGESFGPHPRIALVDYDAATAPRVALDRVANCGTVGASSLQIVAALGFKKVLLLGMDAHYDSGDGSQSLRYFHPEYARGAAPCDLTDQSFVLQGWERIAALCAEHGIEVYNASRRTRLTYFPRVSVEEGVTWLRTKKE